MFSTIKYGTYRNRIDSDSVDLGFEESGSWEPIDLGPGIFESWKSICCRFMILGSTGRKSHCFTIAFSLLKISV